ncbi:class I SAM-dependent methyltransferase [Phytomonospora sp. NPDC050363]|uniref:SAM-dependent methyltransferase n=1 Tax=Phytomonospora sp. NPDC050363 TaxID=3155642 RepID=UPI0033EEF036
MSHDDANREYWDDRYSESPHVWSGKANAVLEREAAKLTPGRALDLGAGEGGDAIWLASRGWRVTAADISQVALDRAASHAAEAGVADRVDWQRHDLGDTFPDGEYDLVSAQFLHSPAGLPREGILRSAARAVAPGGILLIGSHAGWPSWMENPPEGVEFPSPQETVAGLELADGEWETLICAEHEREQRKPDGTTGIRMDNTVMLRRKG